MYRDSIPGRALAWIGPVTDGRAAALYRQQQHMHMEVAPVSGAGESGAYARLSVLISLTFLCELGQRSAQSRPGATNPHQVRRFAKGRRWQCGKPNPRIGPIKR